MKRHTALQSMLREHAPGAREAQLCDVIYSLMVAEKLPDDEIERQVTGALNDGLNHGNWPWKQPFAANLDSAIADFEARLVAALPDGPVQTGTDLDHLADLAAQSPISDRLATAFEYDLLVANLAHVHPEDLVNILHVALSMRSDTTTTTTEGVATSYKNITTSQLVVPGCPGEYDCPEGHNTGHDLVVDRSFTVSMTLRDLGYPARRN